MLPAIRHITRVCAWPPCNQPFEFVIIRSKDMQRQCCSMFCAKQLARARQRAHYDTGTLANHFWAKVTQGSPHECWLWHGAKTRNGYGRIYVLEHRRVIGAHVVSWFLHTGTWPPAGINVLHNCPTGDLPACVNWAHLWLGTHQDNMLDMLAKGRANITWRKISTAQELELCALYATGGWTYKQLAEKYGLTRTTPYDILKRYGHSPSLPGTPERRMHAARGERSANAKITDAQWQEALTLYATGEWSPRRLAKRYGVHRNSIRSRLKRQL